jgi:hypothetical protein
MKYVAEGTLYFLKSAMKFVSTTGLQPAVFAVWRSAKIQNKVAAGYFNLNDWLRRIKGAVLLAGTETLCCIACPALLHQWKQALVAVMNKLLKQVFAVVKHNSLYQPNYCSAKP